MEIDIREFLIRQPSFPKQVATDKYYLAVANKLLEIFAKTNLGKSVPEAVGKRMSLGLTGYFQDIIADAGIWRSFVDANRKLYGFSIPFHSEGEEYIDYELNREDVRFLTWYFVAMSYEDMRDIYPHDSRIIELADNWFDYLDSIYEDSPEPEDFNIARGLDLKDPEDQQDIYHLGQWLFLHCYLITPAFALTLSEIMSDPELMSGEDITKLHDRMEQSMMEDPTGPLALFITEWLKLILVSSEEGVVSGEERVGSNEEHPYYRKFIEANEGKRIQYFATYEDLNSFFVEKMGWDKDQEHLPVLKDSGYFVVLVNPKRGMLVARNVARCISDPANPYYDKDYARKHAFDMLTVRGKCPADLAKFAFGNGWLPDAVFTGSDDNELMKRNYDFIMRCYLQQYYRD